MSQVTNFILKFSVIESRLALSIREADGSIYHLRLLPVRDAFTTGDKNLECQVCLFALNYARLDRIILAIEECAWIMPECVQLLAQGQDEDTFKEVRLWHPKPQCIIPSQDASMNDILG